MAVLLNAIIRDLPTQFIDGYDANTIPVFKEIIGINGYVWNGTLAIAGLMFAFSLGYNIARAYGVNDLAGGLVSVGALIQGIAFSAPATVNLEPGQLGEKATELLTNAGSVISQTEVLDTATGNMKLVEQVTNNAWGWLKLDHLNGNAFFTAMILGFVAVIIFAKLMNRNITIKMPEQVPPAVSKAFAAIIPALVALYAVGMFNYFFTRFTDVLFIDWVQKTIADPLLELSQGFGAVMIITVFIQLFWFFGIHGMNVLAPALEGIWGVAQIKNVNLFNEGGVEMVKEHGYLWVRGSFDAFSMFGGSGGTIVLIIAILIFSKRADYKTIGKLSLGPGIFNINEPVMFGLPIVLNPIMFVPFLLAPIVTTAIGYFATINGWVDPVSQQVVWVTPPLLLSFLATGADWRAPVVSLICMIVAFIIYAPFVIAANKMEEQ
ncbi:PTS sugar transporter subunit IIC [Vagococcus xieshaowenii]